MHKFKQVLSNGYLRAGVAVTTFLPVVASAQSSDPFEQAMETAGQRVASYAGALVGLAAIAVVFMIAVKYVKKIPRAS